MSRRIGGVLFLKVNGVQYQAKGNFTYNLGINKKEGVAGIDGVHGYKETPVVPFIEGAMTDYSDLDLAAFQKAYDAQVTLEVANGKTITLGQAWYAGEGNVTTEEGEIAVRFEGMTCDEAVA